MALKGDDVMGHMACVDALLCHPDSLPCADFLLAELEQNPSFEYPTLLEVRYSLRTLLDSELDGVEYLMLLLPHMLRVKRLALLDDTQDFWKQLTVDSEQLWSHNDDSMLQQAYTSLLHLKVMATAAAEGMPMHLNPVFTALDEDLEVQDVEDKALIARRAELEKAWTTCRDKGRFAADLKKTAPMAEQVQRGRAWAMRASKAMPGPLTSTGFDDPNVDMMSQYRLYFEYHRGPAEEAQPQTAPGHVSAGEDDMDAQEPEPRQHEAPDEDMGLEESELQPGQAWQGKRTAVAKAASRRQQPAAAAAAGQRGPQGGAAEIVAKGKRPTAAGAVQQPEQHMVIDLVGNEGSSSDEEQGAQVFQRTRKHTRQQQQQQQEEEELQQMEDADEQEEDEQPAKRTRAQERQQQETEHSRLRSPMQPAVEPVPAAARKAAVRPPLLPGGVLVPGQLPGKSPGGVAAKLVGATKNLSRTTQWKESDAEVLKDAQRAGGRAHAGQPRPSRSLQPAPGPGKPAAGREAQAPPAGPNRPQPSAATHGRGKDAPQTASAGTSRPQPLLAGLGRGTPTRSQTALQAALAGPSQPRAAAGTGRGTPGNGRDGLQAAPAGPSQPQRHMPTRSGQTPASKHAAGRAPQGAQAGPSRPQRSLPMRSKPPASSEDDSADAGPILPRPAQPQTAYRTRHAEPVRGTYRELPINKKYLKQRREKRRKHPWTDAETKRLAMLYKEIGKDWVEIKRRDEAYPEEEGGPLLRNRTPVQLKDKVRNIQQAGRIEYSPEPADSNQSGESASDAA